MKLEFSNIILSNKKLFNKRITLNRGSYEVSIYVKRRSGPGEFNVNLESKNILIKSKNIKSTSSILKNTFKFNSPSSSLDLSISTKYPGKIEISRIKIIQISEGAEVQDQKHIAFVIPYGIFGGAEVYIKNILEMISDENVIADMLYIQKNPMENLINLDFVKHVGCYNFSNFRNQILSNNYDCIFYYNSRSVFNEIKNTNVLFNSKVIEIIHSDLSWSDSIDPNEDRSHVDLILKVSEKVCKKANKFELFPPVINTERFKRNGRPNSKTVGTVARFSNEKNLFYILELAKNLTNLNFIVIGEGSLKSHFVNQINNLNLKNVKVANFCLDVEKYYKMFDLFLLPSNIEGLPMTIIEAMSCDIPVIAPSVGGISSLIKLGLVSELKRDIALDSKCILDNISKNVSTRSYVLENYSYDKKSKFIKFLSEKSISSREAYQFENILECYYA